MNTYLTFQKPVKLSDLENLGCPINDDVLTPRSQSVICQGIYEDAEHYYLIVGSSLVYTMRFEISKDEYLWLLSYIKPTMKGFYYLTTQQFCNTFTWYAVDECIRSIHNGVKTIIWKFKHFEMFAIFKDDEMIEVGKTVDYY